jgi:hypothetical protein
MGRNLWLALALTAIGGYEAGTVWLIQFSGYPLWPYVAAGELAAYSAIWGRCTFYLLTLPCTFAAAGTLLLLAARLPLLRWTRWTALGLQAGIALMNWLWIGPLERQTLMTAGLLNPSTFATLLWANWVRIALVTSFEVLCAWMLWRCVEPGVRAGRRLLFAIFVLSMYGVGNVWFVHLLSYRLWPYVGRGQAFAYHIAWWHSIWGVIFIPAGVVFLGSALMLRVRPAGVPRQIVRIGFALQLVIYALTAAWWGPLMARLVTEQAGLSMHLYGLLMTTHWLRLALITAYGATCCFMMLRMAASPTWSRS